MDIGQIVATNLRRIRHAKGFSQEELAHRAGVDRSYVSLLENGNYSPTVSMLEKLALALEIDPGDFFIKETTNKTND